MSTRQDEMLATTLKDPGEQQATQGASANGPDPPTVDKAPQPPDAEARTLIDPPANALLEASKPDPGAMIESAPNALATTARPAVKPPPLPQTGAPKSLSDSSTIHLSLSQDDEIHVSIADPLLGLVVAERYRLVEVLGRGGMGIVYKVEHTQIGKLLAMKLLTGELSRNREVVHRFKQEALMASRLSSPNTVQVFDFGAADGLTYLVMELVTGEDLGHLLRAQGPLPFSRVGKIMVQVCSSLSEAHTQGIIHRDMKPENIMIIKGRDETDLAKVLDFGLAKIREGPDLNELTSQGAIVGTPYYMSPEQIRGELVDARSDIYSLGAVMYRILTGCYPFPGNTPMAVFTKHLSEPPVPPSQRVPDRNIPPSVDQIVLRALAKDPKDRFQKVEELQATLIRELCEIGSSSVDNLLNTGMVKQLALVPPGDGAREGAAAEIATRDEVAAYERKLRRKRGAALTVGIIAAILASIVAIRVIAFGEKRKFSGVEVEPNNTAAEANAVPLGRTVGGFIGKRTDLTQGDRDFYALEVPATEATVPAYLTLSLAALPNMSTCLLLYRVGLMTAMGRYCVGKPARDLVIPVLRVEPGKYLVAIMQDLTAYGGSTPYIHENVSDHYTFVADLVEPDPGLEIEPNDQVNAATLHWVGKSISGAIHWAGDEDVYCVSNSTVLPIRWKVRDSTRDPGTVLEAIATRDANEGAPVRVHVESAAGHEPTKADAVSPWVSELIEQTNHELRCLKLRLTSDPWNEAWKGVALGGSQATYTVEVLAGP